MRYVVQVKKAEGCSFGERILDAHQYAWFVDRWNLLSARTRHRLSVESESEAFGLGVDYLIRRGCWLSRWSREDCGVRVGDRLILVSPERSSSRLAELRLIRVPAESD